MRDKIFLGVVLAAFTLSAQTNQAPATTNSSSYSAGPREDLSRLAGQMLDDTNQARAAIKAGNHQLALQDVKQAQHILYNIGLLAPGVPMVPVYREFVSVSVLAPVSAEHQARQASEAKAGGQTPAAVQQVAADYTHVSVSTAVARISLEDARMALMHGDWKTADAALSDVQEGVEIESIESDMPLARARENLILARAAMRHSQYPEAKAALDAACKALSNYAAEGGTHADQARALEQQVSDLAGHVQQESASAVSKISGWWRTTSSWSPYRPAQG